MPEPLHPAVVHLPLALAMLSPFVALAAVIALARGWLPVRAWIIVVLLQALLLGTTWAALETGEEEEERVEKIVGADPIEAHEEAAEKLLQAAVAGLLVSAAGLLGGSPGRYARLASVATGAVVLAAAMNAGHLGGELVYRYGAAEAYIEPKPGAGTPALGGQHGDHD